MIDNKKNKIRVFLIDDHQSVREGMRSYLTGRDIAVVGEASDAPEALRKLKKLSPDIIVLDVNLPSMYGCDLALRLRRLVPRAKILAFSIHSSVEYMMKMARCGARGYVTKDQSTSELLNAIKDVFMGGLHFPAAMTNALLSTTPDSSPDRTGSVALTSRELEVLTLLAEGFSNKGVAARLGIGVRTAETHREHLSRKLDIHTVAGLTKYVIQRGPGFP